jgi:hypothetical protein
MEKAHQTGALVEGDFPEDLAPFIAETAADPAINPLANPQFKATARDLRMPASCRSPSSR